LENPIDQAKLQDAYAYLTEFENSTVIIDEIQYGEAIAAMVREC